MLKEATSLDLIEQEIAALADEVGRRMARWLDLIAQFDVRSGARRAGFRSTSDWLAWRCGLDARTAREHVRVARRLSELPRVADAFADGELSYSKVRAIARTDFEDEHTLLALARASTTDQLEAAVRGLRNAPSGDVDVARRAHERRRVEWWWDDDGALRISAQLSPEEGAAFIDAIETGAEALHPEEDPAVVRPPLIARRADALAEIVLSGAPATQVVLHADLEALACTATEAEERRGEVCALEAGPAVPSDTARRLSCDGEVVSDLGRRRRVVSPALRASLERRDAGCRFPGCTRRHGLHAHHLKHWVRGGRTDKDNLVLLCPFHHRLLHEDGFTAARSSLGEVAFRGPDGREVPAVPARAGPIAEVAA